MSLLEEIAAVCAGMLPVVFMLGRISYQIGKLVAEFDSHVREDDKFHTDMETRMRFQERRRFLP